jgi:hypothetical protein
VSAVSVAVGASPVDDVGLVVASCLFERVDNGVFIDECGGITIKNITAFACGNMMDTADDPNNGQATVVANSIIERCQYGVSDSGLTENVTEDYNTFYANHTDRNAVTTGGNSITYPSLVMRCPTLLKGYRLPFRVGELSEWSQIAAKAGWEQYHSPTDFYGFPLLPTSAKRSWGAVQYHDAVRSTTQSHEGSASYELSDAGEVHFRRPVSAVSTTFKCRVYREANYAGTNPQMIIRQVGQADDETTDAAAASQFNELSTTLTPDSGTDWVEIILRSNNTATSGSYAVYFDLLEVE